MLSQYLGLSALAVGLASAWTFPDCEPDNCYRNLLDSRFTAEVGPFCKGYLDGSIKSVATDFSNCDSGAASSACSCIYYTMTHTSGATTSTASSSATTTPSSSTYATSTPSSSLSSTYPTATPSSTVYPTYPTYPTTTPSTTPYPTSSIKPSIVYTTSTYTITSCASTVTDCPVGKVTTTVCPISSSAPAPVYSSSAPAPVYSSSAAPVYPTAPTTIIPVTTKPVGTGSIIVPSSTTTTSLPLQVTGAAGRVERGIELAVAAGALALAVL